MGSVFSKPKAVKVPKVDIAGDIGKYVSGYSASLPNLLAAEREYRPEFLGLNLADINSFLSGAGGQKGIFELSRLAQQEAGQSIEQARQAEMQSMLGQAPAFRLFAQTLSPESREQVDASNFEAARATQSARQLTPEERRMSDQATREAYASRGMLNSRGSIGAEVLGRSNMMAQKRAEAAGARAGAFDMAQQFYTAPGLQALGNAPLTYQAGQNQLQFGLGAIGSATPQMINPDAGVNIGAQQRANQVQANAATASARASWQAGMMGLFGDVAKSFAPKPPGM